MAEAWMSLLIGGTVLLAIESGVLPVPEQAFVLGVLPSMVLVSAFVCAGLLLWAGRTPVPAMGVLRASPTEAPSPPDVPPELSATASRTRSPPGPNP